MSRNINSMEVADGEDSMLCETAEQYTRELLEMLFVELDCFVIDETIDPVLKIQEVQEVSKEIRETIKTLGDLERSELYSCYP